MLRRKGTYISLYRTGALLDGESQIATRASTKLDQSLIEGGASDTDLRLGDI
jgi:hypothetical protein